MTDDNQLDTVAEAIRDAYNEVVFSESNDEAWLRLAQAAINALKLTPEFARRWITAITTVGVEWEYGKSVKDVAELPPRYGGVKHVTRLVSPWVEVQEDTQ